MRDVACAGYVAGCNTQWFAKEYGGAGTGMSLDTAATNMMKRLSFADDVGVKYSSMLAFPCWAAQFESGHLDTVMSVTTRLLPWEVTSATGGTHQSFPGGQGAYTAYQSKLNLRSVHFGEDMKAAENQDFISQARSNQTHSNQTQSNQTQSNQTHWLPLVRLRLVRTPRMCAGLHQQRHVLHRPVAPLRPLHQVVHVARARTRPLWPRRDPGGRPVEARRIGQFEDRPGLYGRSRARPACSDGVQQVVNY